MGLNGSRCGELGQLLKLNHRQTSRGLENEYAESKPVDTADKMSGTEKKPLLRRWKRQ